MGNSESGEYVSKYEARVLSEEEIAILSTNININVIDDSLEKIANIKVDYPYSQLYEINDEPNYSYDSANVNENIIVNHQVDYDKLYSQVKKNNTEYMDRYKIKAYSNTTDVFIMHVCHNITSQVNSYLDLGVINEQLINEKLNDLKVFSYSDFASGFYKATNGVLALNVNSVNDNATINHEIAHLIQSASVNELNTENYQNRFGYCYQENPDAINPTYWNWFFESAAESLSANFNQTTPQYYVNGYRQLEALKMANFNFDMSLEYSLFGEDMNAFYNYFNAHTPEEKKELTNMFYVITILNNNSPAQEGINFYRVLKEKYQLSMSASESRIFEEKLKGVVALAESKMFYTNLIKRISGQNVSLSDLFSVISIFEMEISRQTWYQSKYASLESFLTGYNDIQNEFFELLSASYGIDLEELKELYYLFNNNYTISEVKCSFLTEEENLYFSNISASRAGDKKDAIFKVYNDYYGKTKYLS